MPFLRIVSGSKLPDEIVDQVKILGSIIGYHDPRRILVEVSDGLTQDDVIAVTVNAESADLQKKHFESFCHAIGQYLTGATGKSVAVTRPTEFGIHSICWFPNKEGEKIYGN